MTIPSLDSAFHRADFDGYIFDCDGTLADSMPLHYRAWTESLSHKLGRPSVEFTEELFYQFGGMPARHIVERLNRDFGYNLPGWTRRPTRRSWISSGFCPASGRSRRLSPCWKASGPGPGSLSPPAA